MPPDQVYRFKHALVQDAAHGGLLRNARRQLHARNRQRARDPFPRDRRRPSPSFSRSITPKPPGRRRCRLRGKAGHRSVARSALAEAAAQFRKGLGQLALLPDMPERRQKEGSSFPALSGAVLNVVVKASPRRRRPGLRSRAGVVGTARFPLEFIEVSLRAVPLSARIAANWIGRSLSPRTCCV